MERGTVDVAQFLTSAGGRAIVVSEGGRLVPDLERYGITHITLPVASKNPLVMLANIKRLIHIIKDFNVDIVHARSRAPAWSAFFAAKQCGVPFITTFHAAYKFNRPLKRFYNSVMARGELVIAISNFIAAHIEHHYGLSPQRVRTIPRGIDLFKFNPDNVTPQRMAAMANGWRIPDGQKVILCPGRLTRIKGHTVLLEALRELKKTRNDFFCLMVGGDQGREDYTLELWDMVEQFGLLGQVGMPGDTADMPCAMMLADVVVNPSIVPEGFGRTPVEAQAMGRPVIVSRLGALQETILDGQTGWMVEAADPIALAKALDNALNLTAEERFAIANTAIAHVRQNYSMEQMCWSTLDVYAEAYGRPVPWESAAA